MFVSEAKHCPFIVLNLRGGNVTIWYQEKFSFFLVTFLKSVYYIIFTCHPLSSRPSLYISSPSPATHLFPFSLPMSCLLLALGSAVQRSDFNCSKGRRPPVCVCVCVCACAVSILELNPSWNEWVSESVSLRSCYRENIGLFHRHHLHTEKYPLGYSLQPIGHSPQNRSHPILSQF